MAAQNAPATPATGAPLEEPTNGAQRREAVETAVAGVGRQAKRCASMKLTRAAPAAAPTAGSIHDAVEVNNPCLKIPTIPPTAVPPNNPKNRMPSEPSTPHQLPWTPCTVGAPTM